MIAATSSGANTNSGMSGWPVERPSASASLRLSILYLCERVRNAGASVCGLSPARPTAWQREQFVANSASPRASGVVLSSAAADAIALLTAMARRKPQPVVADRRRAGQVCMALLAALVLEIDGVAGLGQREVLARLAGVGLRLAAVIAAQVRRGRLRLRLAGDEAERGRK